MNKYLEKIAYERVSEEEATKLHRRTIAHSAAVGGGFGAALGAYGTRKAHPGKALLSKAVRPSLLKNVGLAGTLLAGAGAAFGSEIRPPSLDKRAHDQQMAKKFAKEEKQDINKYTAALKSAKDPVLKQDIARALDQEREHAAMFDQASKSITVC